MLNLILLFLFASLLIFYSAFVLKIYSGLNKLKKSNSDKIPDEFISVLIPFRNEEENILENLNCIQNQKYPEDKFEVLYINDSSNDKSLEILKENIKLNNIKIINFKNEENSFAGKKRLLEYGIENAKGEIIVTTDADCFFGEDWLLNLVSELDDKTGFIAGPVEFTDGSSTFSKIQKLEFSGLIISGAGLIGTNSPAICNAANLAYRKKLYSEVNGFKDHLNISSGDDDFLMQKIWKDTNYKVRFCSRKDAIVKTNSNKTLNDFFHQRIRWASKGLFYKNIKLIFTLILIYFFYLGILAQLVLGITVSNLFVISLIISLILKFFIEYLTLKNGFKLIFKSCKIEHFFLTEFFQIFYIIFAGFFGIFGNYNWKGRKVKR